MLPTAAKTLVRASELRAQREAAQRDEDYEPEQLDMRCFPTEKQPPPPAVQKELCCPKCPRTFPTQIGLQNHLKWHPEATREKEFFKPQPAPPAPLTPVEVGFAVDAEGLLTVGFTIEGQTIVEIEAEAAAGRVARQERERARSTEADRRLRLRGVEEAADAHEQRRGSKRRGSYTPKEKLRVLEIFDAINDDPQILRKKVTFEADSRAKGTPYTTVRAHWSSPVQRAQISAGAGREHASSLLRIDKESRKQGKYKEIEKELFQRFKARRARGRQVSGRWLTAMGKLLMKELDPERVHLFKGGKSWRRRFSLRFKLGVRRKTNDKNKTWVETEPVLLRYFSTLRRRLQLSDGELSDDRQSDQGTEPEPADVDPGFIDEAEGVEREEPALDSSDEEDADDILVNVSDAMPDGYRVMPPPSNEQLEFKGERAVELVDCMLLFNWTAIGWVAGRIVSANIDGRRTVKVQSIGFKQELVCDCRRFLVLSFYPSMHCNVGEWHLHESQL
jgi:hypothetical protein